MVKKRVKERVIKCPKCSSKMVPGKLQDLAGGRTGLGLTKTYRAIRWVEGKGTIFGTATQKDVGVVSYLCLNCGYIENYGDWD
ncbi:MAG: hypothetical protein JSV56_08515 [Methanomassiliicoccales archaeon]|nr:MAG: hypothetical protein JSV56_08515 [Methanomassiliicoccales archaeon]